MTEPATRPAWWNTVEATSASAGVDSDVLWRIHGAETSYGKNVINPHSSAKGPFQFVDATWKALATARPSLNLTDPLDNDQSARAAPWLLKQNNDVLKNELGRDVTPGEQYIGWHAGVGRAASIIKASDGTPVEALFSPQAIHQNAALFAKARTAGEYRAWAAEKMGDSPQVIKPASSDNVSLITSTPSLPLTETEEATQAIARREQEWSLGHAAWESVYNESGFTWGMRGARNALMPTDPNFNVTEDMLKADERLKDIPEDYWPQLVGSRSKPEYDQRIEQTKWDLEYERRMAEKGYVGSAVRFFGAAVDPAGWLISAASPLSAVANVSRFGRILRAGGEAAAGNVLADIPEAMNKPTYEDAQLAYVAAGSFVFGAGIGAVIKPRASIAPHIADMQRKASSAMKDIDAAATPSIAGSGGSALNLGRVEPVRSDLEEFLSPEFADKELGKSWASGFRFDLANKMKSSKNPLTASLGSRLVEDPVGNADNTVVHIATSVEAGDIHRTATTQFQAGVEAAWADYAKRNNIGWATTGGERLSFFQKVSDYVDELNPAIADAADPAVKRAGNVARKVLGDYHDMAVNPGVLDGTVRQSVRAFEDVPKDANYFPHLWDFHEFGAAVRKFGDGQMKALLTEAVRRVLPDLENDVLKRTGKGLYKGLRNVQSGQEVHISQMLSGGDRAQLAGFLREHGEMSAQDIGYIIAKLTPEKETGDIARTKRRTPIDPHTKLRLTVHDTEAADYGQAVEVSVKDLMDRNVVSAVTNYSRQMSTQVALARLRIENPRYKAGDPASPQYLVDGVRGDSDWQMLMKKVSAVADELGIHPDKTAKELESLKFTYETLTGRLATLERGKQGAALRTLRNYNFARMMGQVGWAQFGETWVGVAQVGLKAAVSQMPGLRTFLRNARTGLLEDDVARQIEYMLAPGTDHLRSSSRLLVDDYGNVAQRRGRAHVAEDISQRAARSLSVLSGMGPITSYQQRWFARAALARFAMDATGEKSLNMKRMAVLGIGKKQRDLIVKQLQEHDGYTPGESGTNIRVLNLDKWDPAARYSLERALGLWTRKMVQENDIGQMNMMFGGSMGKLLTQFRTFMLGAYTKNLLHNLHMRDFESASMILGTTVFGALGYVAQTHLQSIGRSDRDKFLERRLDDKSIAAASVQRAAWSSLIPMVADNLGYFMGQDPVFNQRVTGTPAQGIFSNPSAALIDTMAKAGRGITGATINGEEYSQPDARALLGLVPFANLLPVVMLSNELISGLPEEDTHLITRD